MNFDDQKVLSVVEELNKIKGSITNSKDSVDGIIKSISSDWKSEASDQLVANLKKSMNTFQSYIDELNKAIVYLNETVEEYKNVEGTNKASADNLSGNGN